MNTWILVAMSMFGIIVVTVFSVIAILAIREGWFKGGSHIGIPKSVKSHKNDDRRGNKAIRRATCKE